MTCLKPLTAYYPLQKPPGIIPGGPASKNLVFDKRKSNSGTPISIPCGQCIGCRTTKQSQWAIRAMHEKKMHKESCFVTLTYDEEHLPPNQTLELEVFQKFMKRLRQNLTGPGLRFMACGEYGDKTLRPHYHVLLFNYDFKDKVRYSENNGNTLWMSADLLETWKLGHAWLGSVTPQSCRYVASYVVKKLTGPHKSLYGARAPEFLLTSRRPGLGAAYFDRYGEEALLHQSVVIDGKAVPPPQYYKDKWKKRAELICTEKPNCKCFNCSVVKLNRRKQKHNPENNPARRRVKEIILERRIKDSNKGAL